MTVLIDTSFLVALAITTDSNHKHAKEAIARLRDNRVLPIPVMPELFYMVFIRGNYRAAVKMYRYIQSSGFQIEAITLDDRIRMGEIMEQYLDAEFDFVDLAIMAIAERLNIRQICTFDHRDFSIFRPKHCPYFDLLPK